MTRGLAVSLPVVGLLAAGAIATTLTGAGNADGAPTAKATTKPATFEMYADVDAEGHLGSHYDAVKATVVTSGSDVAYTVTFSKPIGHCAAAVQVGKAGGPDQTSPAMSEVVPTNGKTPKGFFLGFTAISGKLVREPFMLTVTCHT